MEPGGIPRHIFMASFRSIVSERPSDTYNISWWKCFAGDYENAFAKLNRYELPFSLLSLLVVVSVVPSYSFSSPIFRFPYLF